MEDKALAKAIEIVDSLWNTSSTYEDYVKAFAVALRQYAEEAVEEALWARRDP